MSIVDLSTLFFTSFILGFTGALTPGPLLVTTVLYSTREGYKAGPFLILGHAMVELFITASISIGVGLFLDSKIVESLVGTLGGVALIWTGVELLKYAKNANLELKENFGSMAKMLKYGLIPAGVLASISNPYFFMWWATLGNAFILQSYAMASIFGIIIFYVSHIMSDFAWYTLVSVSIDRGKKIMNNKTYRALVYICALFLIALAFYFIHHSIMAILTI